MSCCYLDRLLGLMRMPVARVDAKFTEHLFTELGFRKHTGDGVFQDACRPRGSHLPEFDFDQRPWITRMMAVEFLVFLPACQPDLGGIDHYHMIARVQKRNISRFVFSHQQHGDLAGNPAEHGVLGVEHVPSPGDFFLGRELSFHGHRFLFGSHEPLSLLEILRLCQPDPDPGVRDMDVAGNAMGLIR